MSTATPARGEISLWRIAAIGIRQRYLIAGTVFTVTAMSLAYALLQPEFFTVGVSFKPQASAASLGELTSLAAQFGVPTLGGGVQDTPEFYAELVHSREVLASVAVNSDSLSVGGVLSSLDDLLEIDESDAAIRLQRQIDWLREDAINVAVGRQTGIVSINVRTKWAVVSQQLAHRVLETVDRFNAEQRRSRANAERQFVEDRWEAAEGALRTAEDAMRAFLRVNRAIDGSPDLVFERERLQREVTLRQQLYISLSEALEQSRIAEVRDTPVLTVIQGPYTPPHPDRRNLLLRALAGIVVGGILAILLVAVRESRPSSDEPAADDYDEVARYFSKLSRPRAARRAGGE